MALQFFGISLCFFNFFKSTCKFCLTGILKIAVRPLSIAGIHCIVVNAPADGNDSIKSWEEEEEISDPHEAEELENQKLADNYGNNQRPWLLKICKQRQNHNQRVRKHQTVTEVN